MLRLLPPLLLALVLAGCDCGGTPPVVRCTRASDCGPAELCIDEVCVPRSDGSVPRDGDVTPRPDAGPAELRIEPLDPVIDATGVATSLDFRALLGDSEPSAVAWLLDDVVLGTIDGTGLFRTDGLVAGTVGVTARYGTLEARTTITVRVRATQNVGDLAPETIEALRAGGPAAEGFRWLYPYDETVFPRGLPSPLMQLGGGADALRVTVDIAERSFHYEGFFAGSRPIQVALPEAVWAAASESAGAGHSVVVGVTRIDGGVVSGPAIERWRIAQGRLTGSIYYNTYDSDLARGGAVMRVRFGEDAQVVQGGCTVCHSVSANGTRIATGLSWSDTMTITGTGNPIRSGIIELDSAGGAVPGYSDPDGRKFSFGALTPDGSMMLSSAVSPGNRIRGLSGIMRSQLWDASTGALIDAPSFTDAVAYAVTPQFAPDGSGVAFSWFADGSAENGRVLGVMSFDGSVTPPLFGTPRRAVVHADPGRIVGWPSFTPDGTAIVFQDATGFDTSTGAGAGRPNAPVYSDLRLVDLTTCAPDGSSCSVSSLDRLNGYLADGTFYPPYGAEEEASSNYEPTVLPIAIGGYYWVVFTSRRAYGNTIAPGGTVPGGEDRWGYTNAGGGEVPSVRKKLWIAAIDLTGSGDRSHPAFYLSGQELQSGNMRGFAALDPCRADGATCESAADCCGGFCRPVDGEDGTPVLTCVPPPEGCSEELEACTVTADCCGAASGSQCINQRCAQPTLI